MDETKEGGDYPDYDNNNINVEPSPFAPSDLSISGIDTSQSSHKNSIILREKIVIVGDAAVGKSSIVQSFLSQGSENFHNNKYLMTTDVDLNVKQVPIPDTNITVDLFLFDMAGQSIFNQRELLSRCWKDCSYIMCVFDISSRKTLQSCETWIQAIHSSRRKEGNVDQIPTILVANKVDLRQVRYQICRSNIHSIKSKMYLHANLIFSLLDRVLIL
jgi:small GTP-binding protein